MIFVRRVSVQYVHTHDHTPGEIPERHQWYLPGRVVQRDSKGNHGAATHGWLVIECDNPGCLGEALVKLESFTTGIPLGNVNPDGPEVRQKYEAAMESQSKGQKVKT
jgi:hypothetical protein